MSRRTRIAVLLIFAAALWLLIAAAFAAGYATGVAVAASRPAQLADLGTGTPRMTTERVSPLPSPDVAGQDEAPDWSPGVSRLGSGLGRITPSPAVAGSSPQPTSSPRTAKPSAVLMAPAAVADMHVAGVASTYGPGWDGWLALPEGPGVSVRICGAGGCVTRTSNDAGPDLAMQRAGRIVDLDVPTFEAVCGVPWTRGLCRVTVIR